MACSGWSVFCAPARDGEGNRPQAQKAGRGAYNTRMEITLAELEQAINHWRILHPSRGEERALSAEVNALANVYARMIFERVRSLPVEPMEPQARQLLESWLQQKTGT
jgi:hypothetical protein